MTEGSIRGHKTDSVTFFPKFDLQIPPRYSTSPATILIGLFDTSWHGHLAVRIRLAALPVCGLEIQTIGKRPERWGNENDYKGCTRMHPAPRRSRRHGCRLHGRTVGFRRADP